MMQQYFRIKEENPDCLLLFRLGDFYEMFGDDAETGSRDMEITLTSREYSKGKRIPMCGVPHHALESYVSKLISAGHRVAICDQVEDAKLAKGLVKREVIRIITPGTILEGSLLDSSQHSYLASIAIEDSSLGLSFIDVSSGEFIVTEIRDDEDLSSLSSELSRRAPRELLLPEDARDSEIHKAASNLLIPVTFLPSFAFLAERAESVLKRALGLAALQGVGLDGRPLAASAAAAAITYLEKTQKRSLEFLGRPRAYSLSAAMLLDSSTVRNLELVENIRTRDRKGTLLEILDHAKTPMGRRLIREWILEPLLDPRLINQRLDAVAELIGEFSLRTQLIESMDRVRDLQRLVTRIVYGSGTARDLLSLSASLAAVPDIRGAVSKFVSELLKKLVSELDDFSDLRKQIDRAIREDAPAVTSEGGMIRPGFDQELDQMNEAVRESREWISSLEKRERARLGIKSLKVGYNKVFGYYIEVSKANLHLIPDDYIRKQTLVGGERFITAELEERERSVLSAEEKIQAMELEILRRICSEVSCRAEQIRTTADSLALLDALASLATTSTLNNYSHPSVNDGSTIRIVEGRHPVVERTMPGEYIPNDALLNDEDRRFVILTGPNMAGKSTFMRQTALIVLMAQMGSFVPAKSAEIGVVDRVFTRVGAFDDLFRGQSTFMVEMLEVANILNSATPRSLILLDEMGRGTSTFDGLSIAWAVAEHISDTGRLGAKTIFATHYHQLTDLANILDGIVNQCMAVKEVVGEIIFLRKVVDGRSDRSYGVHVAQLAGLPKNVLRRAEEVLERIEEENSLEVKKRLSGTVQMRLFGADEDELLKQQLLSLDSEKLSPEEAHEKLKDLMRIARRNEDAED